MSVIGFTAHEIKAVERAAVALCGEHLRGPIWGALYVANLRAEKLTYEHLDLTDDEQAHALAEYESAVVDVDSQDLQSAEDIFDALQKISYNIISNGGTRPLEAVEGMEQARRVVLDSVAFELMPVEGSTRFIHLDAFAHIRRVDFDRYEISSRDPQNRTEEIYLLGGLSHAHEGLITTDPREAFRKVWQMHDDCFTHWSVEYHNSLRRWAQERGLEFRENRY